MRKRYQTAAGVTLVEVLIVVGILAVLLTALLLYLPRIRERNHRAECADHLRQIGLAMKLYANAEARTQAFPKTRALYSSGGFVDRSTATWGTGAGNTNGVAGASPFLPQASGGVDFNDVTAAMFLILRTQNISPDLFNCPSTTAVPFAIPLQSNVNNFTNWTIGSGPRSVQRTLSYSMQNPYGQQIGYVGGGFQWNDSITADFVLMADINPGVVAPDGNTTVTTVRQSDSVAIQRRANSANHDGDGQNVLYADAHVNWSPTVWAGVQGDNIYASKRPDGKPTSAQDLNVPAPGHLLAYDGNDSILLPTDD